MASTRQRNFAAFLTSLLCACTYEALPVQMPVAGDLDPGDRVLGDMTTPGDATGDPGGDDIAGDPVAGDSVAGDPVAGDPLMPGDPLVTGDPLMSGDGCLDMDNDGVCAAADCDDSMATGFTCFNTCQTMYRDADQDGYGDPTQSHTTCVAEMGYVGNGLDCADAIGSDPACGGRPGSACAPNLPDICDGSDNDCNPDTDDGSADPLTGSECDGPDSDDCTDDTFDACDGALVCDSDSNGSDDVEGPPGDETCSDSIDNDCDSFEDSLDRDCRSWWNGAWTRRIRLSFQNSSYTRHVDFPVLVTLTSLRIADYALFSSMGSDIRFVDDDDSTVLSHEVERWSPGGNSHIWVGVPEITGGSDSDHIWMYYSNSQAVPAEDASGVWDDDYTVVWHMNTSPGAATTIGDSKGVYNGTKSSSSAPASVAGWIGGAQGFNGNSGIVTNSSLGSTANITLEAWVDINTTQGNFNTLMEFGDDRPWFGFARNGKPSYIRNGWLADVGAVSTSSFVHVLVSDDGTDARLYVDGQFVDSGFVEDTSTATGFGVGNHIGDAVFHGIVDEVRVSRTVRSGQWIGAQYDSMTDAYLEYGLPETY